MAGLDKQTSQHQMSLVPEAGARKKARWVTSSRHSLKNQLWLFTEHRTPDALAGPVKSGVEF
jgi:hypothetical protein